MITGVSKIQNRLTSGSTVIEIKILHWKQFQSARSLLMPCAAQLFSLAIVTIPRQSSNRPIWPAQKCKKFPSKLTTLPILGLSNNVSSRPESSQNWNCFGSTPLTYTSSHGMVPHTTNLHRMESWLATQTVINNAHQKHSPNLKPNTSTHKQQTHQHTTQLTYWPPNDIPTYEIMKPEEPTKIWLVHACINTHQWKSRTVQRQQWEKKRYFSS